MKRKSKKIMQASVAIIVALAFVMPGSAMVAYNDKVAVNTLDTEIEVTCTVNGEKATRWIPTETLKSVIDLGKDCKVSFLTIFNKWAPEDEVEVAFDEVSVFFDALIANDLTDKTSDELEDLFWNIRNRIRKPRKDPSSLIISYVNDDPQTCGNQNGQPTPVFGNIGCGLFNFGLGLGFAFGTHTILPTIGVDFAVTWADAGETISIGSLGFTTSTGPEFGITMGFAGVIIATPIMMVGPFFQVGFASVYIGAGPMPV